MVNHYLAERNSEARRAEMIAAALSDSPRFRLSRAIACLLMTRLEYAPAPAAPRSPDQPAALRQA